MPDNKKIILAYIGLFLMTCIVGLSFMFVKIGLRYSDSYDLLAHRFTAALVSIIILRRARIIYFTKLTKKEWIEVIGLSMFYPILCFAFQTIGMNYSTSSQAGIVFSLLPVFTLIAAGIFLKEKTTLLQKLGIFISVVGLIYISFSTEGSFGKNIWGIILMLLSVFAMVCYYMLGKNILKKYNSLNITAIMTIIGFIIFNSISITRHLISGNFLEFFTPLSELHFIYSIIYLGILSSVVTSFLTNYGLTYISTANISTMNNISPIVAIIGGVVFLKETLFPSQIIGGLAVLFGVALVLFFNKGKK